MRVIFNPDKKVVEKIQQGLKQTGGYCPCRIEKHDKLNVCVKNLENKLLTKILKVFVTVDFTTNISKFKSYI